MPPTGTGTVNGKVGKKSRCEGCASPRRKELDAALIAHTSTLQELASRFGGSTSALSRHQKHVAGAIVRATARIVAPPPDSREIEAYEDRLLRQMRTLQGRSLSLLDDAEKEQDGRLRAVAIAQIRENIIAEAKLTRELVPSDTTPAVLVSFSFPPSGLHTSDPNKSPFENAADSWQREAVTGRTTNDPTSGIPENAVPAQGNVEPEERQVEEIVAAQAKARDFSIWKAAGVAPAAKDGTDD